MARSASRRLPDEFERIGIANNTLVVLIEGNNGGSGEGGADGSLNEVANEEARRNNVYPIRDSGGQSRGMKMAHATGAFRSTFA